MDLNKYLNNAAPSEPQYSKEEYAAMKKTEREAVWAQVDARMGEVLADAPALQGFLDFIKFPLGEFICVTGISGSGKSSLINEILYKTLACELNGARSRAGKCDGIEGLEFVDKVIGIDQQPIGRTPRSNPATYTGVFNDIRTTHP